MVSLFHKFGNFTAFQDWCPHSVLEWEIKGYITLGNSCFLYSLDHNCFKQFIKRFKIIVQGSYPMINQR